MGEPRGCAPSAAGWTGRSQARAAAPAGRREAGESEPDGEMSEEATGPQKGSPWTNRRRTQGKNSPPRVRRVRPVSLLLLPRE